MANCLYLHDSYITKFDFMIYLFANLVLASFKMDLDIGTQWKKKNFFIHAWMNTTPPSFFTNKYSTSTLFISNYGYFKPDNSGPTDFEILRDECSVLTMI